jgi:hypothetical protein
VDGSSWLHLSSNSGSDDGGGSSIGVSVDTSDLNVGTYNGVISLSALGSGGANVVGNPQISVTLNVTGSTVNVAVAACQDAACDTPGSLPGALVSLSNGSGTSVASGVTDANGNVSLANIPNGSYTLMVNDTDESGASYTGSSTVTVMGGSVNVSVDAVYSGPGSGDVGGPSA